MVKPISATITENVIESVDNLVATGKYRSRSHAVEEGLKKLIAEQES